ncbi:low affinity immunoglobulin epsilon Fc receptor-like [Erythrolamprus reginae]|uniref:low affinity immunoglobulin epsilon Fc receptor-like n=1 Tax=Erythrolamprus reginae TaxID=121349 RepID=UPI00396C4422
MASSQGIYKACEEPNEQRKKPSKMLEAAGNFLPQSCRGGSGVFPVIIILVTVASFLLWIIIVAVMASKYSNISKELEELRLNQTLLTEKGLQSEKQFQQFQTNNAAHESAVNKTLKKLEDDHDGLKSDVNKKIKLVETQGDKNAETVARLIDAVYQINASGCQVCPKGWVFNGGKCYYVRMGSEAWSQAGKRCESYQSKLVIIDNFAEQKFLTSVLNGKTLWIGLSDMNHENKFVWVDSSSVSYTSWAPREPNNSGHGEDCVVMSSQANGRWEDRPCGKSVDGWICEKSWKC